MSSNWGSKPRREEPSNWPQLRQHVISRAKGLCEGTTDTGTEAGIQRCTYPGRDVDHIKNLASGGTYHLDNLQYLCLWHHKQKTAKEAAAARRPRSEKHPREQHPGFL